MKKVALSMMAIAITFASIAQTKTGDKQGKATKERTENHQGKRDGFKGKDLGEKLNLTDAQKAQQKALQEDFRKQMKDLKDNGSLTQDQAKERRLAIAKEHQAKMQAILTPEQKAQAQEMRKDYKAEGKEGKMGRGFDGAKMKEELNLTDAQANQMKTINERFANNMKQIHDNASLSQDQKKEQMKTLQQKHRDEIQSLLTTEQKEKMKERMKNHSNRRAVK